MITKNKQLKIQISSTNHLELHTVNTIEKKQPKLTIALLAAGQASRFGSPKQLARYQGKTLIERSITLLETIPAETIADTINSEILIITGAHHPVIHQHLTNISKDQYVVFNQDWQKGMSSSIKTAVTHCSKNSVGIMFVTVDQIHITPKDIQSLINCWQQETSRITCAQYADHQGVPAIFPREYFSKLLNLQDDKGARSLIKSAPNVNAILLPNAELDIDTVEQLNAQII